LGSESVRPLRSDQSGQSVTRRRITQSGHGDPAL